MVDIIVYYEQQYIIEQFVFSLNNSDVLKHSKCQFWREQYHMDGDIVVEYDGATSGIGK